ncbi:glycosyl transferase family 1 [Lactiplantibacillus paraplantarum]|uniref:glycosyltransferase n=1 Tax=Lactiplantibacillus paraplantarum TaxID=60520 RepID=UPI000513FF58|nr:glycosyltransferase [Lactiplantibacillus paraplantarum]ALO02917.1 glycosyl transferase family 1 [Lactiplantibacillus paraplantarum]KGE75011.1 glycosyl transferase family 1 [Lactiplantibacillus paraplantarum]
MIRVMQINSGQKYAGVSAMIYNLYQNMDHDKVQFDFVAPKKTSFGLYRKEIESQGGRIIELNTKGNFLVRKIQFFRRLSKLIRHNRYQVVHINSGSIFLNIQVSWLARRCGVKTIIAHSHAGGNVHPALEILTKLMKPLLEYGPTDYFACSNLAAKFMFLTRRIKKHEYTVINNAIEIREFQFDMKSRMKYRKKLNIDHEYTLLHVGRFMSVKNHQKLINVFNIFHREHPDSVLLLAGEGDLLETVQEQVASLGLADSVKFLGLRKDIPQLMSAADVFVLPSLFEGLPVVGVEAQTSGLPCVFSDSITSEVNLFPRKNAFVNLQKSDQEWSDAIYRLAKKGRLETREEAANQVANQGYALTDVAKQVQDIYLRDAN